MKNIRIAVQIKRVKNSAGKGMLKASVPMNLMFEKDFDADWLNSQLKIFEERYTNVVNELINISKLLKTQKKERVLLYWKFGNELISFIEYNDKNSLFLENITEYIARDVEVSDKMINRTERFRSLYPNISLIDKNKSFDSYLSTFEGGYISAKRR